MNMNRLTRGVLAFGLSGSLLFGCGEKTSDDFDDPAAEDVVTDFGSAASSPPSIRNKVNISPDQRAAELQITEEDGYALEVMYVRCVGKQAVVSVVGTETSLKLDEFSEICADEKITKAEVGRLG